MREPETERLRLRRIRPSDAEHIFETWARDPEVTRYLTWQPHESADVTRKIVDSWVADYDRGNTFRCGIERKADGVLMGMIDIVNCQDGKPEIGYCLGKAFWNRGYMTEALKAVLAELFGAGYETVLINAVRENIGSNRVIKKAGFTFTGVRPAPEIAGKPWIKELNTYEIHR